MEMITNNNIKNNVAMEQVIPVLFTLTGHPTMRLYSIHGNGKLQNIENLKEIFIKNIPVFKIFNTSVQQQFWI